MRKRINSCQKGKAGERELAAALNDLFPGLEAHRGQQHHGGSDSPDVVGLPGVHIECKRVERLNITEAMTQAVTDAMGRAIPAVFHRRNREQWLVTIRLSDLIAFCQKVLFILG
jgi:Holliday junction resolvase